MKKLSLFYPVKPRLPQDNGYIPHVLGQGFGLNGEWYRKNGINVKGHTGIDMGAGHGEIVRAAHDGEVSYAGVDSMEGYGVVIRTLEPFEYEGQELYFKTIYWHLIKEIPVKVGQKVKVGDIIGYADSTGFSTGSHLHFGLKPQIAGENDWTWANAEQDNGYFGAIDPMPYFNGYFAEEKASIINKMKLLLTLLKQLYKLKTGKEYVG